MTGVNECSQQRGNLKDDGYKLRNHLLLCSSHPLCSLSSDKSPINYLQNLHFLL
ncbi:hypothetical protein [Photorhabdus laumondii]|uniref:hypothetical protein n=1 Tax=Photorhabdus laumondii TaxID=2218628 RepID=UPI0033145061